MSAPTQKPLLHMHEYKLKQDPQDYGMADDDWSLKRFRDKLRIVVYRQEDMEMEFDMIGCHPAFANAFRRLMLSEVPSMAIEKVHIYNNTSIIQDEVLAHRLGMIPLKADPRLFEYVAEDMAYSEHDSLEYELAIKCVRKTKDTKETSNVDNLYKHHQIFSGQIKWVPIGKQNTLFQDVDVLPIHEDILISKMRPGHELDIKLIAVKGLGNDHAKFSPVATAFYRILPEIQITRTVTGEDAKLLQSCFSPGVIGIDKQGEAFVENARYDSCSRNIFRHPHLTDAVTMSRVRDHFIFTIESVGALKPEVIFVEAIKCLKKKCRRIIDEIPENK